MPSRTNRAGSTGNRKFYSRIPEILEIPNLIDLQTTSFAAFVGPEWIPGATPLPKGTKTFLAELLEEISPIRDFTGKRLELSFLDYEFKDAKVSEEDARAKDATYARPLMVTAELKVLETGEIRSQQIYMGDFPWMTSQGTFIINGAERVVVSQLVRSPGVFYTDTIDPVSGRALWSAKVIPNRGAWLEFETSGKDQLYVKVDRKRKLPATSLLRAVGYETNDEIAGLFSRMPSNPEHPYVANTLEKDTTATRSEALVEVYKRLRPGDPPTGDNARSLVENLFFNARRYDLGRVGRYKFTQRLKETAGLMNLELPGDATRTLTREDLAAIVGHLIIANEGGAHRDVTDHLGNRRVRANGELIQNAFRVGLLRMERVIKERMTIQEDDKATPSALVNVRPVVASMKEFFGGSQLSQFMDQTNPLAELTSKRRLSALGPGGLSRERAGFDVRDVHHSHYGRICPIETPEGPNIGLIGSLATFGRVNNLGFIETPYRRVKEGRVTTEVVYLPADEEERFAIAQANAEIDESSHLIGERIYCRKGEGFELVEPSKVEFMDVSPKQVVSVATALIPFLEHDDANRALMGSNMMRQAVPLLEPHAPVVGTGVEGRAARDSGQVVIARRAGVVTSVAADLIVVEPDEAASKKDLDRYVLLKFVRSNQGTCLNHRPSVAVGDRVTPGQVIADSMSTDQGELALGQNVVVAYMSWEGYNYEDAIIISERLVREDVFTSVHIEKHETEARDTKLGPEEITRDIANVPEELLANLDEKGVIYVGAAVRPGDILVGKITPKGETEVTAEERLLRAIFGEKAREVKDSSLRLPHGERGTVVEVREFLREDADLSAGVNQLVRVSVAQKRKISVGDKMAGRHGNKGVVSRILPVEDMPYLPDGTPVDVILNPLGVPSRMNIGQLLETHLGWALAKQGLKGATPVFDGATEEKIIAELEAAGLPVDGKITLRDGKSGKEFDRPITVGVTYMLKLHHLVEDKIHARSTGPYSLITQQPLGGKAQFGGQRFGEMEVWALQAYGAANILQEILTVKSDDVVGRVQAYEAIVKGERIQAPGVPESFKVLVKELQSLGINVEILNANDEQIELLEDPGGYATPNLGINLSGFESGADF
ncbi:MAG: DNA-directed RNA polymerase subunit beta [Candidatus Limnocylindrus sp.]|nr:MAG: DNA-directed RNA polymerase subunit beta [Candidatus Limnocylindrus sp.]